MPTIVHPHDAFTGTDLTEEQTWAGTPDTFVGVPYRRNTLKHEWTTDPESEEHGAFGAVKQAGYRQKRATGDVEIEARLDPKYFHFMLGNAFGEERLVQDKWVDDSAAVGANTHWYLFNPVRPSLRIRKHLSGPSNAGSAESYAGCKSAGFRFELPRDGGIPFWVFRYVARDASRLAESSNTIVTAVGAITSGSRMLSNAGAFFKTGASLASRNIYGFSIDVNIPLTPDEAYANNPAASLEPGITGNRTVDIEIVTAVEQTYFADGQPYDEFIDATFSAMDVILSTGVDIISGKPWAIRFNCPKVQWREGAAPIENSGQVILTLRGRAIENATTAPNTGVADLRCGVAVINTAAGDTDTYYTLRAVHS